MIEKFSEEDKPINLSISLHSPYEAERTAMMPVNKAYPIDSLLKMCNIYTGNTMRRLTFEYAVIFDVNDSPQHAKDLAKLLKGMLCHVNLIPLNETADSTLKKSSKERIKEFRQILKSEGIETTVRLELGSDIEAACGQLRKGGKP
jgi:23S rRNA (adenine2503-C2)-methyltransferase